MVAHGVKPYQAQQAYSSRPHRRARTRRTAAAGTAPETDRRRSEPGEPGQRTVEAAGRTGHSRRRPRGPVYQRPGLVRRSAAGYRSERCGGAGGADSGVEADEAAGGDATAADRTDGSGGGGNPEGQGRDRGPRMRRKRRRIRSSFCHRSKTKGCGLVESTSTSNGKSLNGLPVR